MAGTNGKGSVCTYIKTILMAEGKKTGFFTSPHLVSVNERIQISGEPVDDGTFTGSSGRFMTRRQKWKRRVLGIRPILNFSLEWG